jgi:hypothetical protein
LKDVYPYLRHIPIPSQMAAILAFPDDTHVVVPPHTIPYAAFIEEIRDAYPDDEDPIEVLIGTPAEAERAIEAFQIIHDLLPDIAVFNAPTETTPLEHLEAIRIRLNTEYPRILELITDNEVFEWMSPTNEVRHALYTLTNDAYPFQHLKHKRLTKFASPHKRFIHFFSACYEKECEPIARWLYSLGGIDSRVGNSDHIFHLACARGNESIARWLHSLGANIHTKMDYAFRLACEHGHESIARWLHSLGANIHACRNEAYRLARDNGHETIAQWLRDIGLEN